MKIKGRFKPRMESFVKRGGKLLDDGNTSESMKMIEAGLEHYSKLIVEALTPYAQEDAGLISLVLRHLAEEVEINNPGAKELSEGLKKCVKAPRLIEVSRNKKPNRS